MDSNTIVSYFGSHPFFVDYICGRVYIDNHVAQLSDSSWPFIDSVSIMKGKWRGRPSSVGQCRSTRLYVTHVILHIQRSNFILNDLMIRLSLFLTVLFPPATFNQRIEVVFVIDCLTHVPVPSIITYMRLQQFQGNRYLIFRWRCWHRCFYFTLRRT